MTKQEIINDETLFQRACEKFVERNVIYCVSSLMYDIGQNLEASAKIFDFDYDEAIGWFQRDDWEEPVAWFIRKDATLDQLEEIAGSDWDEIVVKVVGEGSVADFLDDTHGLLREEVLKSVTDFEEVGREYNLDPYVTEVYEHHIIDRYYYQDLLSEGEIVFEFGGMLIWGRTTTGMAISMDSVTRRLVRELPDDHWIFWDEK